MAPTFTRVQPAPRSPAGRVRQETVMSHLFAYLSATVLRTAASQPARTWCKKANVCERARIVVGSRASCCLDHDEALVRFTRLSRVHHAGKTGESAASLHPERGATKQQVTSGALFGEPQERGVEWCGGHKSRVHAEIIA